MEFFEVEITNEMRETAERKARELGELRNSITRGDGNVIGFLGEMAANKVLNGEWKNTRDYDIVTKDGKTWDAKSKRCTSEPKDHFECSITDYNTKQKCDMYIFVRVLSDKSKAWVLGYMPKNEYYEKAVFVQQGQLDPSNGWRAKCDCWNLPINQLNEVKQLDNAKASA